MVKNVCLALLHVALTLPVAGAAIRFELPQLTLLRTDDGPVTGVFDVTLRADAADLPRSVASFNVDLRVNSAAVTLGPPQTPPTPLLTGDLSDFSPGPQAIRAARDIFPESASLTASAQLVRVPVTIAAGATGPFALSFGAFNQLANDQAIALPLNTNDTGTIAVWLAADFTEDNHVTAADLANWKAGFGASATHLEGDANGDHDADGADFLLWQRQLGKTAASASASLLPEPGGASLAFIAVFAVTRQSRQRRLVPTSVSRFRPRGLGQSRLRRRLFAALIEPG